MNAMLEYLEDAMDRHLQKTWTLAASGNKLKVTVPNKGRTKPYPVTIKPADGPLNITCSCPACDRYGDCIHSALKF